MSSKPTYMCTSCGRMDRAGSLLDALTEVANNVVASCLTCGSKRQLKLAFPFAFGASGGACTVLDCFMPAQPDEWTGPEAGRVFSFRPFLVVLEHDTGERSAWWPYWHVDSTAYPYRERKKYGQWASIVSLKTTEDLLSQARKAGFFNGITSTAGSA